MRAIPGSVSRVRETGGEPEVILADASGTCCALHEIEETGTLIMARTRDGVTDLVATPIEGGPVTPLGLWSVDRATGVQMRITTDGVSTRPAQAPDGQSLVFPRRSPKGLQITARVSVDGTSPSTALVERSGGIFEAVLTADGRTLVRRQDTPGTGTLRDSFVSRQQHSTHAAVLPCFRPRR